MGVTIRSGRALVGMASLVVLGACGDKDFVNVVFVPIASNLSVAATSQGQTGIAGAALANPVIVRVFDQAGRPLAGALVNWTVFGIGGSVPQASSITDLNGDASIIWTLGNTAGADTLRASLLNGASALITATGTNGAFAALAMVSGDAQTVIAGATTAPFVVKAVDANGNAVAGQTITWVFTGGGTVSNLSSVTDANGMAQIAFVTSITPGPWTVVATSGTASATFTGNSQ
jgi:adhesin/invasin